MRTYTIEMLRKPEIYQLDSELATLARKAAVEKFQADGDAGQLSLGDIKRQFLNGEHAEAVFEYLERVEAQEYEKIRAYHNLLDKLIDVVPPQDVTVDIDGQYLKIKAPFDGGDLNRRLNRLGGRWDDWNKCSIVPLTAVESLPKIFANWEKKYRAGQVAKAAAKAEYQAQRERERREREAAWAAQRQREAEQRKATQRAEDQRRARAVASRVLVKVGEHKIGDILDGRPITGFGKSWTEATLSGGQLWQECDYGRCQNEPVCVHCFKCSKHCGCDTETFCYAYFE